MKTLTGSPHCCPLFIVFISSSYLETCTPFSVTLVDKTVTLGAYSNMQDLLTLLCMQDRCLWIQKGRGYQN